MASARWPILAAGGVDLLITDCHMPGLDGLAMTRRIRAAEPPGHRLPIIALSASALPEQVQRCLDAGVDDFLAKPVQLAQLANKLAQHLHSPPGLSHAPEPASRTAPRTATRAGEDNDDLIPDLLATCREDLARLDNLPASELAARRELLHRMEGALALVAPLQDGDVFTADAHDLGQREREIRERVTTLEASLAQVDDDADAR